MTTHTPDVKPTNPTAKKHPVAPAAPERTTTPEVQHSVIDPATVPPAEILRLQRSIGNRAATRLIQTKLTVGPAHDQYEQEADQVAEQVMRMPVPAQAAGTVQRAPEEEEEIQAKPLAASITPLVQRTPEEEEVQTKPIVQRVPEEEEEIQAKALVQREPAPEEEEVQTKPIQRAPEEEEEIQTKPQVQRTSAGAGFEVGGEFEQQLATSHGGGSPLSDNIRSFMEPRFGADFSGVRIHASGDAAQLNRAVQAQAFTHGQDIYLGEGKTDLGSAQGKQLLAHELTHVVQQTGSVKPGVQRWSMGAKGEGHEILTRESLKQSGFTDEEIKTQFGGQDSFVEGSKWNDLPGGYGAAPAIKGVGPDTAITNRSHNKDMQFLHGMAMAEQQASRTVEYMLAWAQFCYTIAQGGMTKDTLLSDISVPLIQGLFPDTNYKGKKISWLFMVNDDAKLKAVAMGSMLHMIQDTFCAAHTQRARKKPGEESYGKIRAFQDYGAQDTGRHGEADTITKGETDAKRVEASVSADDAVQTGAEVLKFLKANARWNDVERYLKGEVFVLERDAGNNKAKATRHFRTSAHADFKKKLPFYFTWSPQLRKVVETSESYDALLEYKSSVGIQYKSEMVAVKSVLAAIAAWKGSKYAGHSEGAIKAKPTPIDWLKGEFKAKDAIDWLAGVLRQDETDIARDLTEAEKEQVALGK